MPGGLLINVISLLNVISLKCTRMPPAKTLEVMLKKLFSGPRVLLSRVV
jgi:hypothetical protein